MHTHTSSIDWERLMKRLVPFFALVLLTGIVPVSAQTATPEAPTVVQGVIRDVAEVTQTLGIFTVVILVTLFIIVGVVGVLLVAAWKGLSPLLSTLQNLLASRDRLQQESEAKDLRDSATYAKMAEALKDTAVALKQNTEFTGKLAAAMNDFATKKETESIFNATVTAVTEHADGALKPIAAQIDSVISLLTADREEHTARSNALDGKVDALDGKVDEAIRELRQLKTAILKGDTNPLDPSKVPDTDPTPSAPNAAADVWQGDHPEKHEGD